MEREPNLVSYQKSRNYYNFSTPFKMRQGKTTFMPKTPTPNEPGGMLRISSNCTGEVYEAYFYQCYGSYGGAISIDNATGEGTLNFTLNDVYFAQCVATYNGGACNFDDGTSTVNQCIFKYNIASEEDANGPKGGGAIYGGSSRAVCTINDSVFYGNESASGIGGAICIDHANFTITDCSFLYTSDSICTLSEDAELTFSGTNFIGASVEKTNGQIESTDDAKFVFINYEPIEFTCSLGDNNIIELSNSAVVVLNTAQPSQLIINAGIRASKVGEDKAIATASWLSNDLVVTYNGVTDQISNLDGMTLEGTTLHTQMTFYGCMTTRNAYAEDIEGRTINFITDEYSEEFGCITAADDKIVVGSGATTTTLTGTIYADSHAISISDLTYSGRIYGGSEINESAELVQTDLTFSGVAVASGMRINGGSRITGDNIQVTSAGSKLTIGFSEDTETRPGSIFAGAAITGTNVIYNAGTAETTINSGNFIKVVGNGSNGNYGGTLNQSDSTMTINGGTFWGRVYAGGYSMADAPNGNRSTADVIGDVQLIINGGTFNAKVYGGCAADYDYLSAHNTSVHGNVTVIVNCSENTIAFNDALFAGSQVGGRIYGNTKMVFTGSADNLQFGEDGYGRFYGGSQNESDEGENFAKFVSGTRTLEFNDFSGRINARFVNFDEASFCGSQVAFARHNDLSSIDTWNFDVSDDMVDLTWNNANAINNFDGDTINLNGWDGVSTRVFMEGSSSALRDFDKATLRVYDGTGTLITEGYSVSNVNGRLQIAATLD